MNHKIYNLEKLNEISQGDQEFIRDMLGIFVENVTADIAGIQSFKTAGNWTAIAETAHKLASNFAYLGADDLHALSANIEKSVINDRNLEGVAEKADKLCHDGMSLINQLKVDFDIEAPN